MNFQNMKIMNYFQMVFTIFAMVMCIITWLIYHIIRFTVSQPAQDMALETEKITPSSVNNNVIIPEKLERYPLYFFGDSLYDTGMGLYINKGPRATSYPYGTTFFKRPAGRFSDGLLIPDFLVVIGDLEPVCYIYLRMKNDLFRQLPLPEPYGNPRLTDYTKSVNFADSAAGVLVDGRPNTLGFKSQAKLFVEMVKKMEKKYGMQNTRNLVSEAVVLNIGANDYVDMWLENLAKPLTSSLVDSFINKILGNFTISITSMYYHGARKFAFQNYGRMGCLPMFLWPDGSCSEELNELCNMHNKRFAALASTWAHQMPGLRYIIYDFYTSMTAHLFNGSQYGFKETRAACCGRGPFNKEFSCAERNNFTLCEDISSHLFFDPAHPTQEADMQFAREFWAGPPHLVTPFNLKTFFIKTK